MGHRRGRQQQPGSTSTSVTHQQGALIEIGIRIKEPFLAPPSSSLQYCYGRSLFVVSCVLVCVGRLLLVRDVWRVAAVCVSRGKSSRRAPVSRARHHAAHTQCLRARRDHIHPLRRPAAARASASSRSCLYMCVLYVRAAHCSLLLPRSLSISVSIFTCWSSRSSLADLGPFDPWSSASRLFWLQIKRHTATRAHIRPLPPSNTQD